MKWSFYNIIEKKGTHYILYNSFYENITILVANLVKIISKYRNNIDMIKTIHPTFYEYLVNKKFIVEHDTDEVSDFITLMKKSDSTSNNFRLIINPTLDCNLRCWYCYEEHRKDWYISESTNEAIKELIKKKFSSNDLKRFSLSFFGGEPLLCFEKMHSLIVFTKQLCNEKEIDFRCDFTTNAVLLSPTKIDLLLKDKINIRFQVPFDGNREYHDKTKKLLNGKGTFDIVIKNIKYALSKDIPFTIRLNYTKENIDSFKDLINEFIDMKDSGLINFSIQKIWQERKTPSLLKKKRELIHYISQKGLFPNMNVPSNIRCYGDKEDSVVVNYNGDIYKCTACDFVPSKREGILKHDGTITYNSLYEERLNAKYNCEECKKCNIWPICTTCTQQKIKILKNNSFNEECSSNLKEEIIRNRINSLIKY